MSEPMTQEEYVEHAGNDCPLCKAKNSASLDGEIESDGVSAWGNCSCEVCGAMWNDVYELKGFENLCPYDPYDEPGENNGTE